MTAFTYSGSRRPNAVRIVVGTIVVIVLYSWLMSSSRSSFLPSILKWEDAAGDRMDTLENCYHVYLDVGSNVGIQIRKLYEPHLFQSPVPAVAWWYDKLFGNISSRNYAEICTVGFEPNPSHKSRLQNIEKWYSECKWPVRFFTETAVSDRWGTAKFFTDDARGFHEWGASIVESNNNLRREKGVVRLLRLSTYINDVVAKRKLGRAFDPSSPPSVLMKMDIEGAEIEVMTDLIMSGAIRHVNMTMIEWHWNITTSPRINTLIDLAKGTEVLSKVSGLFNVGEVEDETYFASRFPKPGCAKDVTTPSS